MKISIIIPIYNEETTIEKLIATLEPLKDRCEILFVDGGSTDCTLSIIGDRYRVFKSEKGRAKQMNYGARHSTGDVLFFLHCDSEVPRTAIEEIEEVMKNHRAGCFGIAFRSYHFFLFTCRVISNHRIKDRKIMFGDQGIFVERDLFFEIGMFPDIPIMEDYQFSLFLKERGIKLGIAKHRIYTSMRRFEGNSIAKLQVMWKMNRLRAMYRKGIPPAELALMYKDIR